MTFKTSHVYNANLCDGDNRNTGFRVSGENMRELRESDLKLQHGTIFKRALKS